MTISTAIKHSYHLHAMWVGPLRNGNIPDLNRIHASITDDLQFRRDKPHFAAVVKEMRGHLILLGKIRKVLA